MHNYSITSTFFSCFLLDVTKYTLCMPMHAPIVIAVVNMQTSSKRMFISTEYYPLLSMI